MVKGMLGRRGPEPPPQSMLGDGHPHISKDRASPTPTPSPTPKPGDERRVGPKMAAEQGYAAVFSAGSPTLWGVESAGGENSQDEETEKRRRERNGMDRGGGGPVCWRRTRGEWSTAPRGR